MEAAATNGNDKAGRADRDDVIDQHVIARMLEMRGQGYRFHDIAAALQKQGLATLSSEQVQNILEARHARKHGEDDRT